MDRTSFWFAATLLLCGSACGSPSAPPQLEEDEIEGFASLPGARGSADPELRSEIDLIEREGGTPERLMRDLPPDGQNVAPALRELFDAALVSSAVIRARELFPQGPFRFRAPELQQLVRFRHGFEEQLGGVRAALKRPASDFGINYRRGFFVDDSFVETVELCVRLQAFQVAEQLDSGNSSDAIEPLQSMFRLLACLAAEKHSYARLAAAQLRAEALRVLEACAQHHTTSRSELLALADLVQQQLHAWPNDADAWIGDRAQALHSYEVIRAGHLLRLLTQQEKEAFQDEGILNELPERLEKSIDADQRFYLRAMRTIIEGCQKPYFQRRMVLGEIRNELHQIRNSASFPFVAARLFLADMEEGHAMQALDRARCEAWAIGLALAVDRERPDYRLNPSTGVVYAITVEPDRIIIVVDSGEDGRVIVPYRRFRQLSCEILR